MTRKHSDRPINPLATLAVHCAAPAKHRPAMYFATPARRCAALAACALAACALLTACGNSSSLPAHSTGSTGGDQGNGGTATCSSKAWLNKGLSADARTELIMACMTQAQMISVVSNQAVPALAIPAAVTAFVDGAEGAPAGIASTKSGTGMPSSSALGATFDTALAQQYGAVVGDELLKNGYYGVWGPTANTLRTQLAGRGNEYYGEDPYLNSRMTVNWINAVQAQGAMVQLKHFVANDQEGQLGIPLISGTIGGRQLVNVVVDDRTLHEIYLAPFEAAFNEANPASIMCSYNRLNGPYACESPVLLQHILRDQFGFKGFVAPDLLADKNHLNNFTAGMDTGYYGPEVPVLLAAGLITQKQLASHVQHILRTFFAFGVMDRAAPVSATSKIDYAAHNAVAEKVAEQSLVLLKNDGILPLNTSTVKSIAVIGPAANSYIRASGSMEVAPMRSFLVNALQGIQARAGSGITVTTDPGILPLTAAAAAKNADVAIVFVNDAETEGTDKLGMSLNVLGYGLPDLMGNDLQLQLPTQEALINAVAAANPNTIVVLQTGVPVLTAAWSNQIKGLIQAWYPGQAGGTAIARVIFGDVDPGGRLSATVPVKDSDGPANNLTSNPAAYPGLLDVQYSEGVLVGYRWFDAHNVAPAYPFGFGLSYASFNYSGYSATVTGSGITVGITVTNTSTRAGSDVAQVYLGLPSPSATVIQPPKQLKAFGKVYLGPGQSQRLSFNISNHDLSYWRSADESWQLAPGCYQVSVGRSSRDVQAGSALPLSAGSCP